MRSMPVAVLSVALVLAALSPAIAAAQEAMPEVIVWVNSLKAKPGQSEALTGMLIEQGTKSYDPLIASGAIVNWGVALNVAHDGNDPSSHVEWVSFNGWAGVDQFMAAFMAARQSMSAEDMAAMDQAWDASVVEGSHSDLINRGVDFGLGMAGRPNYIHLGYHNVNPGKSGAMKELWSNGAKPIFEKLAADGDIIAYGMQVPEVHRDQGWTHLTWYSTSNLAARSAVHAAFGEPSDEMAATMAEVFGEGHVDQILMVVHFNEAGAE